VNKHGDLIDDSILENTDFLEILEDLLVVTEERPQPISAAAALALLYILAHERKITKIALISFLNRRVEKDYELFTRAKIEKALDEIRRRRRIAKRVN
jgi:hypothetical protein